MKEVRKYEQTRSTMLATIRSLCIDATNKANSGHPGMPLEALLPSIRFTKHLVLT